MSQLLLNLDAEPATEAPRRLTIQERFEAYNEAHPEVFTLFKRFAQEAKDAGRERFGGKAIWERIRWYCDVEKGGDSPRLNNIYVSRYVRKLCQECPDLTPLFETRELKAK